MLSKEATEGIPKLDWSRKVKFRGEPVPLTLTLSESEKLVFEGKLEVGFPKGSYKYQPEAVLTVWSPVYPTVKLRANNNGFARLELPIPVCSALRDFLMECAFEIDRQLKGLV